ncbi:MAG: hypothetical protein PHH54_03820 [Candidatus Nanoarchaeia archaeon]|nr:hypothetical protein [Candidatus Nanoarchaeia archaeon]MDD5741087.1 hypothetical protein [Candidatus Nanoarchaeia archaeon]
MENKIYSGLVRKIQKISDVVKLKSSEENLRALGLLGECYRDFIKGYTQFSSSEAESLFRLLNGAQCHYSNTMAFVRRKELNGLQKRFQKKYDKNNK